MIAYNKTNKLFQLARQLKKLIRLVQLPNDHNGARQLPSQFGKAQKNVEIEPPYWRQVETGGHTCAFAYPVALAMIFIAP